MPVFFSQWLKMHNFEDTSRLSLRISSTVVAVPVTRLFLNKILKDKEYEEDYVIEGFRFKLLRANLPFKVKGTASSNGAICLINALKSLKHSAFSWNEALAKDLPSCWEIHGDLLMLPEGCFVMKDWEALGGELWPIVASAFRSSRVAKRGHIMNNDFRSPLVTLLLGTNSWVEHVDNRIRYRYDVTKCMFSTGNITEKIRIGHFKCAGETVVDLFAGIGYFTLPYLVHANASLVYACEWNPDAVEALKINLAFNGVTSRCIVLEGDNQKTCPKGVADRVNLGLIPSSEGSWEVACAALKLDTGGILHVHGNVTSKVHKKKHNVFDSSALPVCSPAGTAEPKESIHSCNRLLVSRPTSSEMTDDNGCSNSEELMAKNVQTEIPNRTQLREGNSKKRLKPEWTEWAFNAGQRLKEILQNQTLKDWLVTVVHIEHVKSYAPHIDHLVVDIRCLPNSQHSAR